MRTLVLLAAFLPLLAPPAAAQAARSCAVEEEACAARCAQRWSAESLGRVGCVARCGADLALCESRRLADQGEQTWRDDAQPWLNRRGEELDDLWRGFRGDPPPPPAAPAPPPGLPPGSNQRGPGGGSGLPPGANSGRGI